MTKFYRLSALAVIAMLVVIGSVAPLALPANAAPSRHTLANNLIAYWTLDEASSTRADSVGANHLTDNNTVTQNTGKLNYAAQFTAANSEYLSIADNAELSAGDIDFSFTAWIYLDSLNVYRGILSKWGVGGTSGELEYSFAVSDVDRLEFRIRDVANTAYLLITDSTFGALSASTWYFVVAYHDSINNLVGISINNTTPQTASWTGGVRDLTNPFEIGKRYGGADYWNGRIDSVSLWKRVLTSDERSLLWNGGAGCDYPFTACEPTHTPTVTNTFTPSNTPTQTFTPTSTNTATATFTPTNTATATYTPTDTATTTNTPVVSDTPTTTDTATATSTVTPGPSPTASATPAGSATPDDIFSVLLSSGNRFVVERRATFGEGYIAVGIIGLIVLLSFRWLYDLVRQWLS